MMTDPHESLRSILSLAFFAGFGASVPACPAVVSASSNVGNPFLQFHTWA